MHPASAPSSEQKEGEWNSGLVGWPILPSDPKPSPNLRGRTTVVCFQTCASNREISRGAVSAGCQWPCGGPTAWSAGLGGPPALAAVVDPEETVGATQGWTCQADFPTSTYGLWYLSHPARRNSSLVSLPAAGARCKFSNCPFGCHHCYHSCYYVASPPWLCHDLSVRMCFMA